MATSKQRHLNDTALRERVMSRLSVRTGSSVARVASFLDTLPGGEPKSLFTGRLNRLESMFSEWDRIVTAGQEPEGEEDEDDQRQSNPDLEGDDIDALMDDEDGDGDEEEDDGHKMEMDTDRHPGETEGIFKAIDKLRSIVRNTDRAHYIRIAPIFHKAEKQLHYLAEMLKDAPHPRPSQRRASAIHDLTTKQARKALADVVETVKPLLTLDLTQQVEDAAGNLSYLFGEEATATDPTLVPDNLVNQLLTAFQGCWPTGSTLEELVVQTGAPAEPIVKTLTNLIKKGTVHQPADGRYCLSPRGVRLMERFTIKATTDLYQREAARGRSPKKGPAKRRTPGGAGAGTGGGKFQASQSNLYGKHKQVHSDENGSWHLDDMGDLWFQDSGGPFGGRNNHHIGSEMKKKDAKALAKKHSAEITKQSHHGFEGSRISRAGIKRSIDHARSLHTGGKPGKEPKGSGGTPSGSKSRGWSDAHNESFTAWADKQKFKSPDTGRKVKWATFSKRHPDEAKKIRTAWKRKHTRLTNQHEKSRDPEQSGDLHDELRRHCGGVNHPKRKHQGKKGSRKFKKSVRMEHSRENIASKAPKPGKRKSPSGTPKPPHTRIKKHVKDLSGMDYPDKDANDLAGLIANNDPHEIADYMQDNDYSKDEQKEVWDYAAKHGVKKPRAKKKKSKPWMNPETGQPRKGPRPGSKSAHKKALIDEVDIPYPEDADEIAKLIENKDLSALKTFLDEGDYWPQQEKRVIDYAKKFGMRDGKKSTDNSGRDKRGKRKQMNAGERATHDAVKKAIDSIGGFPFGRGKGRNDSAIGDIRNIIEDGEPRELDEYIEHLPSSAVKAIKDVAQKYGDPAVWGGPGAGAGRGVPSSKKKGKKARKAPQKKFVEWGDPSHSKHIKGLEAAYTQAMGRGVPQGRRSKMRDDLAAIAHEIASGHGPSSFMLDHFSDKLRDVIEKYAADNGTPVVGKTSPRGLGGKRKKKSSAINNAHKRYSSPIQAAILSVANG